MVILFSVSCKKEHATPTTTTNSPVFYFNGTVDGIATSINAGLNNYYMYSSYTQDSNQVYNFSGDLKQTNLSANSISITINDYKVSGVNVPTNIDSSLQDGLYAYNIPGTGTVSTTSYRVSFYAQTSNGIPQTYAWDFGDGATSSLANPIHTYITAGNYNASLAVNYSGGCSSSVSNPIRANKSNASFKTSVSYTADSVNQTFNFSLNANKPVVSYVWNFGDGITSNLASPAHTYSNSALYTVSLLAVDSVTLAYDTAHMNLNIATGTYQHCLTNFTDSIAVKNTINNLALSKVTVNYTDAAGNIYTSKNALQPSASTFQILSVGNYQNNTNNQSTKQVHVKFSCVVYNTALNKSIQITNADAVIALAYK